MPLRVTRLRITNYGGIKQLDMAVPPRGVVAKGRNGAGKSSVLNALRAALEGRNIGPDAIHLGADKSPATIGSLL